MPQPVTFIAWVRENDGICILDIMEARKGSENFAYKMAMRYFRSKQADIIEARYGDTVKILASR